MAETITLLSLSKRTAGGASGKINLGGYSIISAFLKSTANQGSGGGLKVQLYNSPEGTEGVAGQGYFSAGLGTAFTTVTSAASVQQKDFDHNFGKSVWAGWSMGVGSTFSFGINLVCRTDQ